MPKPHQTPARLDGCAGAFPCPAAPLGSCTRCGCPGLACPLCALCAPLGGFSSLGGIPIPLRPVAAPVGVSGVLAGIWA
ncbi:MAG: hypothetical protein MR786_09885 [Intestinimonas butyriciproducens]|nr:hypothetical protein [Intestinimonas butyriciproducens]